MTPRTAGFNTADLTALSGVGQGLTILLMLIGGSPGSTAGGMKTTTFAVLVANALAVFRRQSEPHFFGRRIDGKAVNSAATIGMLYLTLFLAGGFVISAVEGLPLSACLFETASAVGTVGLSLGLTPHLGLLSQGDSHRFDVHRPGGRPDADLRGPVRFFQGGAAGCPRNTSPSADGKGTIP